MAEKLKKDKKVKKDKVNKIDKVSKVNKVDKKGVDIKALQRQIKALEQKIGNQQKALDVNVERKVLGEKIKAMIDEYKIRTESLEKVISSKHKSKEKRFPTIVTAISLILTFTIGGFLYFSGNVITKWAEDNLTKFAEYKVQRVIDGFTIDLEERSNILEQEINTVLTEAEEKGKRSLDNLVASLRKDESLKVLIASVSENVKETDESKHVAAIPEETIERSEQFEEKVAQVKTQENEIPYDDLRYKGLLELKTSDYNTAIKSWDYNDSDRK